MNEKNCECCQGIEKQTPQPVANQPGLDALRYRVGTHSVFLESMLAALSSQEHPALRQLTTRATGDPAVALLDAGAVMLDVLTFYQERIANEGFLRTATEEFSIVELARLIGYKPRPGVAASVFLAFSLENGCQVEIPAGTRAQSTPQPGEQPQFFETSEPFQARQEWNTLRPRLTQPSHITLANAADWETLYLQGTAVNLRPNDALLLSFRNEESGQKLHLVERVDVNPAENTTAVVLRQPPKPAPERLAAVHATGVAAAASRSSLSGLGRLVQPLLKASSVQPRSAARMKRNHKTLFSAQSDSLPRLLTAFRPGLKGVLYQAWSKAQVAPAAALQSASALRVRAAPFGHNARPPFAVNGGGDPLPDWVLDEQDNVLTLDGQYDQIKPNTWIAIERPLTDRIEVSAVSGFETIFRRVEEVRTVSRNAYGITARATQLTLHAEWCQAVNHHSSLDFLRKTTVYAQSEPLALAEEPLTTEISGATLELDALYNGLEPGRWIIVSGERVDIPGTSGVTASELVMVSGVVQGVAQVENANRASVNLPGDQVHTTLTLANALAYQYKRDTVTIYGNVVKATHGESRLDVLGSGNASRALQTFSLKQAPLTFTSAPTPSGIASSLVLRVNGVRWPEVDGLIWLGPYQRGYMTKTSDQGNTEVVFGDGEHGLRLPSGAENVTAAYRLGIGKPGNVQARQISQLITKPLGVKSVINPQPAAGGADPEGRDQARENAPLAVMALDRLVSVQDYASFARTFSGVGKASAVRLSDGRRELVHVTIAGVDDIPITETSDLFLNLRLAFRRYNGDPFQPVMLAVRKLILVLISARVRLLADYDWDYVEPAIRAALLNTFSFARRQLGQAVFASQVTGVIQAVEGVAYVDLDVLDAVNEDAGVDELENLAASLALRDRIPAALAHVDAGSASLPRPVLPAQLAYLSPEIPNTLILTELTQ